MQNMVWYLLWSLAPLVPSVILFLTLPKVRPRSQAALTGNFHGMQLKLGGAAALYFAIFFTMNPVRLGLIYKEIVRDRWELVTSFQNANNETIPPDQLKSIDPIPNVNYQALDNQRIMISLPSVDVDKENNVTMPYRLRFTFADYEPQTISTSQFSNKSSCEISWKSKEICLKDLPKLVLKPKKKVNDSELENAVETVIN